MLPHTTQQSLLVRKMELLVAIQQTHIKESLETIMKIEFQLF